MTTATHMSSYAAVANTSPQELSKKEVGYLALMWGLLAMNAMLMTFINNSFTHCL